MSLFTYLRAFVRNDEGQDLLEYALLVALIAIVCIIAIGDDRHERQRRSS